MSAKEKDSNTLSKLKQFFRIAKTSGPIRERTDFALVPELERELQPETPVAQRCKALKDLGEDVKNNRLEDASIKKLWELTKDLIVPHKPAEQRQTALIFYQKLIQGQYESLSIMRGHFFRVIENHNVAEDITHRLELLKTLTDNGKNIQYFEESIGSFMLKWIPAIVEAGITESFLEMLVNVIKFNAAHLEKFVVVGIIQHACYLSSYVDDTKTVLQCLQVLDSCLCYTVFPTETLTLCIVALCRTVTETYCHTSWRIMKNLLGTNLGHASLLTMCNILNDPSLFADETLLRGAVFHVNMGLWGQSGTMVPKLRCSPSTVLSSFLHALGSQRISVTFEVILGVQRLIKLNGTNMSEPSWDVICDILTTTEENLRFYEKTSALPKDHIVQHAFHETLTVIEGMLQKNEIAADPDPFYALIEAVSDDRTELSVLHLIDYKALKISATKPEWLQAMHKFMDRFYRNIRTNSIRVKAVQTLVQIMDINRAAYEEEILERVVIPHFIGVHLEPDMVVRTAVAKLLVDFAWHCDSKRCLELLDIIEKLLNRPMEQFEQTKIVPKTDTELTDVITVVDGLIDIFTIKLYRLPSSHAIRVFHLLVGHLERYYKNPVLLDGCNTIRKKIFQWMLKARSNATYHIGFPDASNNGAIRFSHYLGLDILHTQPVFPTTLQPQQSQQTLPTNTPQPTTTQSQVQQQQQQPPQLITSPETHQPKPIQPEPIPAATLSTISIRKGCQLIVECLKVERDWQIIELVLKELPSIMQNRALLQGNDMESLATTLVALYINRTTSSESITTTLNKRSLPDFHYIVLPTIASLVPYHQFLGQRVQKEMIDTLRSGLFLRNPRVSVNALTVMLLEMPEMMLRLLPDVLLQMSKMSSTVAVAVPVLEFLSTLNRLSSRRFANFVVVQYMYVFAISVPYTNPYKYDHYTVSLAHHVIAGWFLKCRLPLRRNFVNYIIKGFETNVQIPFQEIKRMDFAPVNEDSSNRKRSSSLTEQGSRRREHPSLHNLQQRPKQDDVLYNFHMELAETCIDFLARHTFSPCSALPKRLPSSEFILAGGQSQTWLVGHNLITITTSGCTSIQLKNGLCDRCSLMCKQPLKPPAAAVSPNASASSSDPIPRSDSTDSSYKKRYTKASLQHANSGGPDSGSTEIISSASSSAIPTPFSQLSNDSGGGSTKFFRQTSTDGRFSNSTSGSLEALSRRGSIPDPSDIHDHSRATGIDSGSLGSSRLSNASSFTSPQRSTQICACSCTGWAEICIRRPTGNMSWVMRIQNQISLESHTNEFPLHDIISLFMPSLGGVFGADFLGDPLHTLLPTGVSLTVNDEKSAGGGILIVAPDEVKRKPSSFPLRDVGDAKKEGNDVENILDAVVTTSGPIDIPRPSQPVKESAGSFSDVEQEKEDGQADDDEAVPFDEDDSRSRNPVRRVNSSPEMSSNWRNPFLSQKGAPTANDHHIDDDSNSNNVNNVSNASANTVVITESIDQQRKKPAGFGKDMRVSCEAIPEEIAGSTPPSQPESVKESTLHSKLLKINTNTISISAAVADVTKAAVLVQSASFPTEATVVVPDNNGECFERMSSSTLMPKKQLSADDAVQLKSSPLENSVKLKLPMDMPKVTTKPPQSPVPLSPRLLAKNAANKIASFAPTVGLEGSGAGGGTNGNGNGNYDMHNPRMRSKTISVVRGEHDNRDNSKWTFRGTRSGISPSSVFLQLYHTGPHLSSEHPIQIGPSNLKAITLLDLIPPFETHKIGVVYVGPGQCNNETEIFRNRFGSLRYTEFLRQLGTLVALRDAKEHNMFINMETNGRDGNFTYVWQDDIVQVTFHVATLMPNKDQDPNCHEKKKHIGNDFVTIVYNESGEEYNLNTIKGQFNYACVVVQPLELNTNRISVRVKDDVSKYVNHSEPKILSDNSAPLYARQLALHANLASLVSQSLKNKNQSPYASNWLERLRKIKHLRAKLLKENPTSGIGVSVDQPSGPQVSFNHSTNNVSSNPISTSGSSASIQNNNGMSNASSVNSGNGPNSGTTSPWLKEDFTTYTQ